MRNFDLTPLFRSTVGFDRLARLVDAASHVDETAFAYPPYNIEKAGEDAYRVTMAVAGFRIEELEISVHENVLTVSGKAQDTETSPQFLHRGIARRAFERRFQLADHIKVTGAGLLNGLLNVELVREVPEALKPRTIAISTTQPTKAPVLDQKPADKKVA